MQWESWREKGKCHVHQDSNNKGVPRVTPWKTQIKGRGHNTDQNG